MRTQLAFTAKMTDSNGHKVTVRAKTQAELDEVVAEYAARGYVAE